MEFFITCPKHLEQLLEQEIQSLGLPLTQLTVAGVKAECDLAGAYKICLWSRLANKVLLNLASQKVLETDSLYRCARDIPWLQHFNEKDIANTSVAIDFTGQNELVRNTQYGAQVLKDGLVDHLRERTGERPSIVKDAPDIRISAYLSKDVLTISLDLSGESLHKRGYRRGQGEAPMKENLAAAVCLRAGVDSYSAILDPMCGSGTLLIEAALIKRNIAPGLFRNEESFGFAKWRKHDAQAWRVLVQDAREVANKSSDEKLNFVGYDENPYILDKARVNAQAAGVAEHISFSEQSLHELHKPKECLDEKKGLMLSNPPYGHRLGNANELKEQYRNMGQILKSEFSGWQAAIFIGNEELGQELRLRPKRKYTFLNGRIESKLLIIDLLDHTEAALDTKRERKIFQLLDRDLSEGATMLANRLDKNLRKLKSWRKKQQVECFRLYDADLPEYSAAIDIYPRAYPQQTFAHIQEYAPPSSVDKKKAEVRFNEVLHATAKVLNLEDDALIAKTRRRLKGKTQYEKGESGAREHSLVFDVREGATKFEVNLSDYIDTGLFLDHRWLRQHIAERFKAKPGAFLNLFCYTATASVHAILGGARESVSVDLSNTYLQWARRNFEKNSIRSSSHELIRSDCKTWLQQCRRGFDIIMLDPPSFSNSKSVDNVLDIQRDHAWYVKRCMELLRPGGMLFFSTNLHKFKLDAKLSHSYQVQDLHDRSRDPDFERNKKIHYLWLIQHLAHE